MYSTGKFVLINNIKLPINASSEEAFSVARGKLRKAGLSNLAKDYRIYRRSIDARRKSDIKFVYSVIVSGDFSNIELKKEIPDLSLIEVEGLSRPSFGDNELSAPPVVVGAGPSGLFAALMLAEHGYAPIILERGGSVKERCRCVQEFNINQILSEETNIQFGAGGAGTFSDGKLVTRINDPLTSYVLERFIEFGAPEEIRYLAKPHVGTDVLSVVVENMIQRIVSLGGKILYHTRFISERSSAGVVRYVETSNGKIEAGALILAIGHSARDTYETLIKNNYSLEAKSFSVGMRIEHLADDIDRSMYGDFAGHPKLGHAEYNLSCDTKTRGTYTFCMCPGGEVVAAASERLGVVVNGMSYHGRSGKNSNSAVVTSIFREDYGGDPLSAIEFQRKIERAAFKAGGDNYSAPIITVGDFLSDELKHEPSRVLPTYMGGRMVTLAPAKSYLPGFVCDSIKRALINFDSKIEGFASPDAILTGAETRTSAPIRILRDNTSRLAIGFENLYPSGEGAGYAGGITSAAIDGVKTALALMKKYKPKFGG